MFQHDAATPTAGGGSTLLPAGTYDLLITKVEEKISQKGGYPMINVTCEVQNNTDFNGAKVFHNVTFMPKDKPGAGMSSHFLKCINQPFEGAISVDPQAWVGEDFKAKIQTREYEKKDGSKAKTNDLKEIMPSDDIAF